MSVDFKAIVGAQRKFFNTNQTKSVEFCRQQLLKLREVVESNRQNIYDAVWKDLHRNAEATEKVEMYSLLMELDYTLDHLDKWKRTEKLPTHPFGEPSIHNEPLGNVCIISAFNFQIVLALRPAISALAAGNTVLVKTSENAPHTSKLLVDMINSNFPQEYFTVVEGDGPATERLLQERFSHIFYTGSPQIGRLVMTAASKHLTPVTLELGGRNATLIEEDADLAYAAKTVTVNKWFNCGQVCLSPDYVLINKKLVGKFLEQLREAIKNEYVPNPKEAQNYSRMINERHFHRIESYIKSVQGELLYKSAEENDVTDKFVGPHVFQVSKEELLKHEEVFGPILLVVAVESFDESIEIVNSNEKCLSLYMITGDEQKVERLTNETSSGSLTINDMIKHFAIAGLPFGGVGESGMGSYHAKFGFDTFTHKKAVLNKRL